MLGDFITGRFNINVTREDKCADGKDKITDLKSRLEDIENREDFLFGYISHRHLFVASTSSNGEWFLRVSVWECLLLIYRRDDVVVKTQ